MNAISNIGDSLIIEIDSELYGIEALLSFSDNIDGVTEERYFQKEFSYTTDLFNYSLWTILSDANLKAVILDSRNPFRIKYRYTRLGTDGTGTLTFNSIILNAQRAMKCGENYDRSIFVQFFHCSDPAINAWALNVYEKVYKTHQLLAAYVERNGVAHDQDFRALWFSITTFFAYIVKYARMFEKIEDHEGLLYDFLVQRGLYLCPESNLLEMQTHTQKYWSEVAKRGTPRVVEPNGELKRLLCWKEGDPYMIAYHNIGESGWVLDKVCPTYKGQDTIEETNHFKSLRDVGNKNIYPLIDAEKVIVDGDALKISGVGLGFSAGVGAEGYLAEHAMIIDETIGVHLSFEVSQDVVLPNITFGIRCFDVNGIRINAEPATTEILPTDLFFKQRTLNQANKGYTYEGYLLPSNTPKTVESFMDSRVGPHLIAPVGTKYVIPYIVLDNGLNVGGAIFLKNIRVNMLNNEKTSGFLQSNNAITMWIRNNNGKYTDKQVYDIIKDELLPYNTIPLINFI